ncbi:restriction endonuclease subunit S [Ureibacillus chungkukjangi]|uniref:restriction endonuclease subunit S n=1 Tax=Ureibacillus chungkukjangi TaxID=1202712 RepID=UPI00384CE93B
MASKMVRLGDCVQIDSGYAFKSSQFSDDKEGIPLIRIRDVNSGIIKTYYKGEYDDKYIVYDGDLLITMDGEFKIKKWSSGKALLNQRVCRIKSNSDSLEEDYLLYLLPSVLKKIEDKTAFVTVKHLSLKDINEVYVNIPPKNIQKKIIQVLDSSSSLIEKRKTQIAVLDELIQSVFLDLFGDPFLNPKGFEMKQINDVAELVKGITYKPEEVNDDGIIVLRSSNVQGNQFDTKDIVRISKKVDEKFLVKANDILMCNRNGSARLVGKVAKIPESKEPMTFGTFMTIIRSPFFEYLFTFFQTEAFRRQIQMQTTVAINQISLPLLKSVKVPLPSIELQSQFASFVQQVDKSKLALKRSLNELENLNNALIQKALKGELFQDQSKSK